MAHDRTPLGRGRSRKICSGQARKNRMRRSNFRLATHGLVRLRRSHVLATLLLPRDRFGELFAALTRRGYRVVGPRLADGAIGYAELHDAEELPAGFTDEQSPGRYRAVRRNDQRLFGYAAGLRSFRDFFQAPSEILVTLRRGPGGPALGPPAIPLAGAPADGRPLALLGARACDLRALAVLDRVLADGAHPDARYVTRRRETLVIAVNCTEPSGTCFCVSMGSGPRADSGYDLALTELLDEHGHRFVMHVGSDRGAAIARELSPAAASEHDISSDRELVDSARGRMGRTLEERGVRELLLDNLEHPAWDQVAERCLACTNCTLVCPTCFCSTQEDRIDVDGQGAERHARHDSCFSLEYSHVHGGSVRASIKARYRQWLTHKFSTWYDQFGSSGCVGCGRCITACPVGIDVTEEIAKIRGGPHAA
jgi:sulfhydrogenase subunit beta (sulfur reductase)